MSLLSACRADETNPAADTQASPSPAEDAGTKKRADGSAALFDGSAPDSADGLIGGCRGVPAPCPMQTWMREHAVPPLTANDPSALGDTFEAMASWGPKEFPHWASIAKDGAQAARLGEFAAARAACTGCHTHYASKYRREFSARPIPEAR